jgi:hypothetical protein
MSARRRPQSPWPRFLPIFHQILLLWTDDAARPTNPDPSDGLCGGESEALDHVASGQRSSVNSSDGEKHRVLSGGRKVTRDRSAEVLQIPIRAAQRSKFITKGYYEVLIQRAKPLGTRQSAPTDPFIVLQRLRVPEGQFRP